MVNARQQADKTLGALKWLVVGLLLAYVASLFIGRLGAQLPFRWYVVQSGSMEPSIMTGDIILIRPGLSYSKNQVVTFKDQEERTVTHRIIEVESAGGDAVFVTKGDANPDTDSQRVLASQIIGQVVFTLPKIGYLVSFAKTRVGSVLFVIIPAVIIVYDEYRDMKRKL